MKKQLSGSALWKSCSENVEKISRKTEVAVPIFVYSIVLRIQIATLLREDPSKDILRGKKQYLRASSVCNGGETAIHYSVV